MDLRITGSIGGVVLLLGSAPALAQPAAAPPAPAPVAIPNPTYAVMVLEMPVNRPAQAVWARIGAYCGIAEWLPATCVITSGVDGQLGAVRQLNGTIIEMLVGKTDLSYTYTQPVRMGVPYNAYHGTLEVQPVSGSTSKLVYSFFYDNSMLADDAARATEATNRRARFTNALQNMKTLAEGGKITPPAPAR